jgi:hypothetical protein
MTFPFAPERDIVPIEGWNASDLASMALFDCSIGKPGQFGAMASGHPGISVCPGQVAVVIGSDCQVGKRAAGRPHSEFVKGLACLFSLPWSLGRATKTARSVAASIPQDPLEPILMDYRRLASFQQVTIGDRISGKIRRLSSVSRRAEAGLVHERAWTYGTRGEAELE